MCIRDSEIRNNEAKTGGGVTIKAGTIMFSDCHFIGNYAKPSSGIYGESHAGAVALTGGFATFSGCTMINNEADNGGALILGGSVAATFSGCEFIMNQASGSKVLTVGSPGSPLRLMLLTRKKTRAGGV